MDNLFTTEQITILMVRARRMRYIYKTLGAAMIGSAATIGFLLNNIFSREYVPLSIVLLLLNILLLYHVSEARKALEKEFKEYVTERGLIEKIERINRKREQEEIEASMRAHDLF